MNEPTHMGIRGIPRLFNVMDCIVEEDLKDLICTTHITNVHLLFGSSSHKNSKVNRA